jgi:protein-tyrosine-phosphatase
MRERGIDLGMARAKHLRRFARRRFRYIVTLCDRVRLVCPEFPGQPDQIHWSIADPATEGGTDESTYPAFERVASDIEARTRFLLHTLTPELPRSDMAV